MPGHCDGLWVDPATHLVCASSKKDGNPPGTVYTEAPSDSGVGSFIGKIDLKTGLITPVITGLASPTGLLFVPGARM